MSSRSAYFRTTRWLRCCAVLVTISTLVSPAIARAAPPDVKRPRDAGVLPGIRLGAALGLGAPEGLAFAVIVRSLHFGVGGRATYLPLVAIPGLGVELARFSASGDVRVYPFGGAFFFGAVAGYGRSLAVVPRSVAVAEMPTRVRASVFAASAFAGPELGLQFRIPLTPSARGPELTIGTDLGLAIPIWTSEPRATLTAQGLTVPVAQDDATARTLRRLARTPLPWLGLLSVGVLL